MRDSYNLTRRSVLGQVLAGLTASLAATGTSWAQDAYPSRPITVLHGYPPGGGGDFTARTIANRMQKSLGQPLVVENLGGAGGTIAVNKLLSAPPDGYTTLIGTLNENLLAPMQMAAVRYKSEDMRLVGQCVDSYLVLFTRPDLPVNSVQDLVALAKSRGDKPLTCGHLGRGSAWHLAAERFAQEAGVKLLHVPYRGAAQLFPDIVAGNVDMSFTALGGPAVGMVKEGKVKALAFAAPARNPSLPNVGTFDESGLFKNFVFNYWAGLMVQSAMPEPIVQKLHAALNEALNDPQVRKTLSDGGLLPVQSTTLAESSKYFASEIVRYRTIAKSINLQPE